MPRIDLTRREVIPAQRASLPARRRLDQLPWRDPSIINACQVPLSYANAPVVDLIHERTLKELENFAENLWDYVARGLGAYFYGPANSGKSVAAATVVHTAMRYGFGCLWANPRYLHAQLKSYSPDPEFTQQLKNAHLVVIDNMRFDDSAQATHLIDWVHERSSYYRSTLITSRSTVREHRAANTDLVPLLDDTLETIQFFSV